MVGDVLKHTFLKSKRHQPQQQGFAQELSHNINTLGLSFTQQY